MNPTLKKTLKLYSIMFYLVLLMAILLSIFYFGAEQNIFGLIIVAAIVLIALVGLIGIRSFRRSIEDKVLNDSVEVANREMQYMKNWDFPYALMRQGGRIFWYNGAFDQLFTEYIQGKTEKEEPLQLEDLLGPQKYPEEGGALETEVKWKDSVYRMILTREEIMDADSGELSELLYSVSLLDISRERALELENANIRPIVVLIYIDNYDQVLSSMEETRRPLLEAMIYKRINDLTAKINGVLTRMEKDRLLLVFPNEKMEELKETRFHILDEVRSINIGNKLPVTLSIGVGASDNLKSSHTYARAAVDLAMSRGGDQAVLKDDDNTVFYGGKSSGVEKTTRVRARLIAYTLREVIAEADKVLLMGHANPDLDCFGAALGMARSIQTMEKEAYIVLSEPHPAVDALYERVMKEGEYVNRILIGEKAEAQAGPKTLLIVLDVNRPSIVANPRLLELCPNVVVIDHHRTSVDYIAGSVVSYVEPYASSCCEMVTELVQYMTEEVHLRPVETDALFAGIALDTKNFTVKTGIRTFDAAAFLRRNGADSLRVRQMFKNDIDEYRARAQIVSRAEIEMNQVAISYWDGKGVPNALALAAGAADELLDIRGVTASFVLTETEELINVSARSLGEINVQLIMEKIGGGGHLTVAGAQMRDMTMEDAVKLLKKTIQEYLSTVR
ncbi:MAG: DHH family phosphoesterase [Firmicutes bacterium]|nr:DHH family phosphoesterase [Bacillota bacterium]